MGTGGRGVKAGAVILEAGAGWDGFPEIRVRRMDTRRRTLRIPVRMQPRGASGRLSDT
jgi:hypothetical protein